MKVCFFSFIMYHFDLIPWIPVKEKPLVRKSMLACKTLPDPITRVADGPHWIRMLAVELSIRLKEARETTPGLWPRTISLHVSQGTVA